MTEIIENKVQIVGTIGLASKDRDIIKGMIEAGLDIARLNFSWGTHEDHAEYIKIVRELSKELGKEVKIVQDLSGPRVQHGATHGFEEGAVEIITEKDLKDLEFGIEQEVDYVAMSFVGEKEDILKLRKQMEEMGKVIPIIAKIERKKAYDNIEEIVEATDAVMVARGDLGNEVPLEQIPFIEKEIIEVCKQKGKPVIVATQMMFSMTENPTPTRAEVTDVTYAVTSGADAVMLSEESASGKYPVEAVTMMDKIISESEKHVTINRF
jgi:pyruvate kinase